MLPNVDDGLTQLTLQLQQGEAARREDVLLDRVHDHEELVHLRVHLTDHVGITPLLLIGQVFFREEFVDEHFLREAPLLLISLLVF